MNQKLRLRLINSMSYIFYLLPLVLLTGPFLPDLFLTIIALFFIYLSLVEKEYKYYLNYFSIIFFTFYFFLIISSFFSDFVIHSLESSLFYIRYLFFSLATWFLIENNKKFLKSFTFYLLFTFIFCLIDGYYQYINGHSLFGINNTHSFRLNLPLDDKLFMGGYLSRFFPFLIGLILVSFKLKPKHYLMLGLLFISTDTLIFITAERTALFLLTLSTLIIIILISELKLFRLVTFIISFIIIIIISLISPEIKERNIDHTINQIGATNKSEKINIFSPQHESHFIGAYNMFKKNMLFGVGPNSFRKLCNDSKYKHNDLTCSTHPHNSYIQLLAETGLFSFLIFSSFIFILSISMMSHFWKIYFRKETKYSDYQICLLTAVALTLWPFAPTLNFFSNWINIIYFMPIGFLLHSFNMKRLFT